VTARAFEKSFWKFKEGGDSVGYNWRTVLS